MLSLACWIDGYPWVKSIFKSGCYFSICEWKILQKKKNDSDAYPHWRTCEDHSSKLYKSFHFTHLLWSTVSKHTFFHLFTLLVSFLNNKAMRSPTAETTQERQHSTFATFDLLNRIRETTPRRRRRRCSPWATIITNYPCSYSYYTRNCCY